MNKFKTIGVTLLALIPSLSHGSISYKDQIVQQMKVTATNIANASTTRTVEGGPYKKKNIYCSDSGCEISEDSVFKSVYDPKHIDADHSGMVKYPDIDVVEEMDNMIKLQELYDS